MPIERDHVARLGDNLIEAPDGVLEIIGPEPS
jgi:hypothetical protein